MHVGGTFVHTWETYEDNGINHVTRNTLKCNLSWVPPFWARQSGQQWGVVFVYQACFGQGLVVENEGVVVQQTGLPREIPLYRDDEEDNNDDANIDDPSYCIGWVDIAKSAKTAFKVFIQAPALTVRVVYI